MAYKRKYGKRRFMRRKRSVMRRKPVRRVRRSRFLVRKPEVKTISTTSSATSFNQQINATGDVLQIFPNIGQGVSNYQRIGDKIGLRSMVIRGVITMSGGDYTSLPNIRIGVRVIICRMKRYDNWYDASSNFGSHYADLIEGSITGYTGDLSSFTSPINRDKFTVIKDKRFYLSRAQVASVSGLAVEVGKSYRSFTWRLPYHKRTVQYNSTTSISENYPYFMLLGYSKLDGSSADGGTSLAVTMQYTTRIGFTDF